MDSRKDILMDENGDVYAKTGDFVIDASDDQHVQHILESAKGDYKQFPLIGANIMQLLNGKVGVEERRDIILALKADNYDINTISFENDQLIIE